MTKKTNSKIVAAPAITKAASGSLMDMLAGAVAAQATGFKQVEIARRTQAKEVVGTDADLLTLQTMEAEAESLGLPAEFLQNFKAKAQQGRELLIEAEAAGQMARRLQAASTPEGLRAHIEKAKAQQAAEKAAAEKAKAQAKAKAEDEAKEARIEKILADLGELTPGQRVSIAAFLRGNPQWSFIPTEGGRKALLGAAGRAAAEFKKATKARDFEAKAAKAAAAPLSHNLKLKLQ